MTNRKTICVVTATDMTIKAFWVEHLRAMQALFNVTIVTNTENTHFLADYGLDIEVIPVDIKRQIAPWSDLLSLIKLYKIFRKRKFDIVHSVTPKAGLLSMMGSRAAFIKSRLHTFTGQVWATRTGLSRWLLKLPDKIISVCATQVLADSQSQSEFIHQQGVTDKHISILGDGSISGVNIHRFKKNEQARESYRQILKISEQQHVFLFLGRLNADKGVYDLAKAFSRICKEFSHSILLLVGPDESDAKDDVLRICHNCQNSLRFIGFTSEPEKYMSVADVLCLPSYREGFGSVIIEAAAVGIPSIATNIYGVTDAVVDGITGDLFRPGDIESLTGLMQLSLEDKSLCLQKGQDAQQRVFDYFTSEKVTNELMSFYKEVLL